MLITGAASGLGRAAGTGFAQEGASLCLADLDADGLAEICRADPREWRNRLRHGSGRPWYAGGLYPCRTGGSGGIRWIGPALQRRRPAPHACVGGRNLGRLDPRSEEHTSELQSLMRISYAVFCLKTKIPHT